MSASAAIGSDVYLTYVMVVVAVLALAGVVIALLKTAGRNVASVVRTYRGWLIMVPIVLATILLGRTATIVGIAVLAVIGFKEFARATGLYEDWWLVGLVYAGVAGLAAACYLTDPRLDRPGWYGLFMALPVYIIATILLVPVVRNRAKGQLQCTALAILGFIYFGWMFSHLSLLANTPNAYGYLLFLIFAVEINDVAAFTFGKAFGRHKLRENVSPNKTIEGSSGAVCVSLAVPWLLSFSLPGFSPMELILTGLIVGIGGQLGDLVISYIKRDIGIKDMGSLIGGHGGILDRVDSMIFVAPLFLHMVRWFHGLA